MTPKQRWMPIDECFKSGCLHAKETRCEIFTEPAYFWREGECPAIRNTPEQIQELERALTQYERKVQRRESK